MSRFVVVSLFLRSLGAGAAQPPDSPRGTWSGEVRYGGESRLRSLRFDTYGEQKVPVIFLDLPSMRFKALGPFAVKREGDVFKSADAFTFRADG